MSGDGMDALRAALGKVGPRPVEVVSHSYAENGLVRLIVRSDASITVEIDAYAAEETRVSDIERHLTELFRAAKVPDIAVAPVFAAGAFVIVASSTPSAHERLVHPTSDRPHRWTELTIIPVTVVLIALMVVSINAYYPGT